MTISIIIEDKLATRGIAEYNYEYVEEGIYQSNQNLPYSWKVANVRSLQDNGSNSLGDYQKHIDIAFNMIREHGKVAICCSYGISRSNAIALGVLVKYFDMNFDEAEILIKQKVEKADINPEHIKKLKKLFNKDKDENDANTEIETKKNEE
ncbi:MAG: dual specificity protein phosphatase family protein [Nitrosopumilus sp.]|nr:dual specificity protein phosphatase family protein [Nitrosopumilus sp.]